MITVGMHYDVREGKEKAFEDGFASIERALRGAAGHTSSRLFRDVAKPRSYLIYSEWKTVEAFQGFIKSDAFRAAVNWGKEEILESRPRHQIWKGAITEE
ncbi:MAG: antibiotic biosynthesis monooxygenase family protein [Polyangiaceae bacterium]